MDATLREITSLVKEVNPDARRKGTYFDFALVSPDRAAGYRMREIGGTCSGQKGPSDAKTLAQVRFIIGDYLDIAITPPHRMNPMPMNMGMGMGMRRNNRPYDQNRF